MEVGTHHLPWALISPDCNHVSWGGPTRSLEDRKSDPSSWPPIIFTPLNFRRMWNLKMTIYLPTCNRQPDATTLRSQSNTTDLWEKKTCLHGVGSAGNKTTYLKSQGTPCYSTTSLKPNTNYKSSIGSVCGKVSFGWVVTWLLRRSEPSRAEPIERLASEERIRGWELLNHIGWSKLGRWLREGPSRNSTAILNFFPALRGVGHILLDH